jgi:hypothetical protein
VRSQAAALPPPSPRGQVPLSPTRPWRTSVSTAGGGNPVKAGPPPLEGARPFSATGRAGNYVLICNIWDEEEREPTSSADGRLR